MKSASPAWANYDAAGNLTSFLKTGLEWSAFYDAENKQRFYCDATTAACSSANDTAEYVYDGEGNRVQKKIAGGATITYVYDAFGRLAAEYSTAGPSGTSGGYFRTTDHLGSTRLVTNGAGNVHDRRDFFPFGEQILASSTYSNRHYVSGYNSTSPASAHLFTGKERGDLITEGGLDYFGARYYSGALGRFTSADAPFMDQSPRDPQSWNLYSYTRNNPLRYVDSSGNFIETLWDVGNVIWGAKSFVDNVSQGNYGSAAVDAAGVIADGAAVLLPGVPGGAGAAIKVGRAADTVVDAAKGLDKADTAVDAARALDNATDVSKVGRSGRQEKLGEIANDQKASSGDRGWIKQEQTSIDRGNRTTIRNPPGKDLAHDRGREAAKGYSYKHSRLQNQADHRLQHKYGNYGRKNKERPLEEGEQR